MSNYGFIFPKPGKTIGDDPKDLAWRDDQRVFLAPHMKKVSRTLAGVSEALDFEVDGANYYVYKAYLEVDGRCYDVTQTAQTDIGRVYTYLETIDETTVRVVYRFNGFKTNQVILAATVCLQDITS